MLKLGQPAPIFALPDAEMESFDLADVCGKKRVVLFFYPKDGLPNCILEVTDFSDHESDFAKLNCLVVGINRDDCQRHAEFRDEHGISIPLLSDADGGVCKRYGVWQQKQRDGAAKFGIVRSTFVISKQGTICLANYGVNARGHALDILRAIKEMKS